MSSSSTSPGETLDLSNQVAKKKKKKTKKKKSPKTKVPSTPNITKVKSPPAPQRKAKFPCRLCKEDHLLRDCPGIPKVLEVWAHDRDRPASSSGDHGDATLTARNVKGKGKIRLPCRLCEGNHPLHLCPFMDRASIILESLTAPSPQLLVGYQRLSAIAERSPADKEINQDSSLVQPPLPASGSAKPIPDQPLVGKSVDSSSPPADHSISEEHHSPLLLISLDTPTAESPTALSLEQFSRFLRLETFDYLPPLVSCAFLGHGTWL